MSRYIDKDVVKAEIDRRIKELNNCCADRVAGYAGEISGLKRLLSFLDTLEVKEVNLEQEIQQHINDCLDIKFPTTDIKMIAKDVEYTARKFFELGLKAK